MESAAGTVAKQTENRHYSFRHQHKHLWHCVWVWILIISLLTPQFSYEVEAKNFFNKVCDKAWGAVTDAGKTVVGVVEDVAHALLPEDLRDLLWNNSGGKMVKEGGRFGHKVEKYTIRPVSDPRIIGKVAVIALVAYFCPPALGTLAGAGGIVAAGAASAAYDRVVLNVHNGGDLSKSFLTAAGSAAVMAAFDKYIPTKEIDSVTGVEKELLSTGEKYWRGVALSASHIAVGQVTELIVEGKGTLGGRVWSGALAGAFVPSVQLVTDNNLVATLMDPINRSVVEQSVVNRFNMNKVDFGAAVASGAQALRDQFIMGKTMEFAKFVNNWWNESDGSKQETLSGKREMASTNETPNSFVGESGTDEDIVNESSGRRFDERGYNLKAGIERMDYETFLDYIAELKAMGVDKYVLADRNLKVVVKSDAAAANLDIILKLIHPGNTSHRQILAIKDDRIVGTFGVDAKSLKVISIDGVPVFLSEVGGPANIFTDSLEFAPYYRVIDTRDAKDVEPVLADWGKNVLYDKWSISHNCQDHANKLFDMADGHILSRAEDEYKKNMEKIKKEISPIHSIDSQLIEKIQRGQFAIPN